MQLALLLWRAGANVSTDAYFYMFNFGMMPTQILVVGVLYPLLLNDERITQLGMNRVQTWTPLVSAGATLIAVAWLLYRQRLPPELYGLAALMAANGAAQSALWFRGIVSDANGDPRWMAAVALPANGLASLTLLAPWPSAEVATTAMAVALMVGNVFFLFYEIRVGVGSRAETSPETIVRRSSVGWFLLKSGSGSASAAMFQSLAVLLPASGVTLLNIAVKIVGSVSTTVVNAVAPAVLHQKTTSKSGARRFMWTVAVAMAVAGAAGVAGTLIVRQEAVLASLVVGLWLITASVSPVAQRMSYRWLSPSAARLNIGGVLGVLAVTVSTAHLSGFSLITLLCAYVAVDGVAGTALLVALREWRMSLLMTATTAAAALVWVTQLAQ